MDKDDVIMKLDGDSDGWQTTFPYKEVSKGMDIWAKELAVKFADFLNINGYRVCDKIFNTWENDSDIEIEYTSEQLFELFLQSQK